MSFKASSICDRCKKNIEGWEITLTITPDTLFLKKIKNEIPEDGYIDLCEKCAQDFMRWFKGRVD